MIGDSFIDYSEFRCEWYSTYRHIMKAFHCETTFQDKLITVIDIVLSKLTYLLSKNKGVHIFINPNQYLGSHGKGILHYKSIDVAKYNKIDLDGTNDFFGLPELDSNFWEHAKEYFCKLPCLYNISVDSNSFLGANILDNTGKNEIFEATFVKLSSFNNNGIYNMGFAIFWNDLSSPYKHGPKVDDEYFKMHIEDLQEFVISNFIEYGAIESNTYLPDYRKIGPNEIAILFCDIRNFSAVTEILRNKDMFSHITKFVNDYCLSMSNVIKKHGRLDKFIGDGIMAIFGEYTENRQEMCARALLCAKEMMEEFRRCKKKWTSGQDTGFDLSSFNKVNNEYLEIDLGIGINMGNAFFDYYGAAREKTYSAIGDHVNYAQRLESNACQIIDFDTGKRREHILISQTLFHNSKDENETSFFSDSFLKDPNRCRPFFIQIKGLGVRYPVYMLNDSDINSTIIEQYLERI